MRATLASFLFLAACSYVEAPATTSAAVVGGRLEPNGYPAAGYLVFRLDDGPHAGELFRPECGAALVAPRAVVTAAHCVERSNDTSTTVVGAGFGDGHTGPTYGVVGTWKDWTHPSYFSDVDVGGMPWPDSRFDVAIVELDRDVSGITPLAINDRPIERGTAATLIGYGRVTESLPANMPSDEPIVRPDHPDLFPGLRKAFDLQIAIERDSYVDAWPKPGDPNPGMGCRGDSGSSLILADGSIAGLFGSGSPDVGMTEVPTTGGCTPGMATRVVNLRFARTKAFIERRLGQIR